MSVEDKVGDVCGRKKWLMSVEEKVGMSEEEKVGNIYGRTS